MHPGDSTAEALLFITGLLVEGRATADAAATLKVLSHLAEEPQPGSEDAFVAVLQTATLQGIHSKQSNQTLRYALKRRRGCIFHNHVWIRSIERKSAPGGEVTTYSLSCCARQASPSFLSSLLQACPNSNTTYCGPLQIVTLSTGSRCNIKLEGLCC